MPNLRRASRFVVVVALLCGLAASVAFLSCTTAPARPQAQAPPQPQTAEPPSREQRAAAAAKALDDPLCTGPGESYQIKDFPCTADQVSSWVHRNGGRTRIHAWNLFAGLNQLTPSGQPLWRTWPTSSQVFPNQFGSESVAAQASADLAALPGGILEHAAEGTPRFAGSDLPPGVDPGKLELPGGPDYQVPRPIVDDPRYRSCLRQRNGVPHLIDGPSFQNNGDVMIAAVVFSPDLAEEIAEQRYWDARRLDQLLPQYAKDMPPPGLISMPHGAISLKLMFWPVRGDSGKFTPLPVWDSTLDLNPDKDKIANGCEVYAGFESYHHNDQLWNRAVALNAGLDPLPTTADASYLGNANAPVPLASSFGLDCKPLSREAAAITYSKAPTVPLYERFYTVRFTAQQLAAMDPCDRALLDQSAYWSYGRPFDSGDALAMIAMHIMTKEVPGWTFQSAWWSDKARECSPQGNNGDACGGYAQLRTTDCDPLKNYLMVTTYGIKQHRGNPMSWPSQPPPHAALWPVAYNPYIELAVGHPIETNCMNCHRRAAWPNRVNSSQRFPGRKSAYLAPGKDKPGLLDAFSPNDGRLFPGLVEVDSLWTLSDRAYYPVAAH